MMRISPLIAGAALLAGSGCSKPADKTDPAAMGKSDSSLEATIAGDAQFKTLAAGLKCSLQPNRRLVQLATKRAA
jgi:hypothetical protein